MRALLYVKVYFDGILSEVINFCTSKKGMESYPCESQAQLLKYVCLVITAITYKKRCKENLGKGE